MMGTKGHFAKLMATTKFLQEVVTATIGVGTVTANRDQITIVSTSCHGTQHVHKHCYVLLATMFAKNIFSNHYRPQHQQGQTLFINPGVLLTYLF
jgi:hypothetical protein